MPGSAHPPLAVVQALFADLAARGRVVLGGSGLLYALGLVDSVRDWDLVTDVRPEQVAGVLADRGLPAQHLGGDLPAFATTALLRVDAGDHQIDVLVDFAIRAGGALTPIPPRPWRSWHAMTLGRPEDWRLAYELMGREDKAALLRDWLVNNSRPVSQEDPPIRG